MSIKVKNKVTGEILTVNYSPFFSNEVVDTYYDCKKYFNLNDLEVFIDEKKGSPNENIQTDEKKSNINFDERRYDIALKILLSNINLQDNISDYQEYAFKALKIADSIIFAFNSDKDIEKVNLQTADALQILAASVDFLSHGTVYRGQALEHIAICCPEYFNDKDKKNYNEIFIKLKRALQ